MHSCILAAARSPPSFPRHRRQRASPSLLQRGPLLWPHENFRCLTMRSAAAQATGLFDQACSRMSRCSARVQRLAGLGRSSDHKGLAEFKPLACGRKKPSEVELESDMHNACFTNKIADRHVACTVIAIRRIGTRTGLSQLVVTCALAMLLIAIRAEGRWQHHDMLAASQLPSLVTSLVATMV